MRDVGLVVLRLTTGGLLAGHGAQKLFGAFEGPGPHGTAQFVESLGLKPGHLWGRMAGLSEFGGGTLTALGFLHPLGPISAISAMAMAAGTAHRGKPIWVTAGGAELPVTNMAVAMALLLAGPDKYSLDSMLGLRLPRWFGILAGLTAAAAVAYGLTSSTAATPAGKEEGRTTLQGGEEASDSRVDEASQPDTQPTGQS